MIELKLYNELFTLIYCSHVDITICELFTFSTAMLLLLLLFSAQQFKFLQH